MFGTPDRIGEAMKLLIQGMRDVRFSGETESRSERSSPTSSRRRRSVAGSKATKILSAKEVFNPDRWKNARALLVHSMSDGEPIQNELSERPSRDADGRGAKDPLKSKRELRGYSGMDIVMRTTEDWMRLLRRRLSRTSGGIPMVLRFGRRGMQAAMTELMPLDVDGVRTSSPANSRTLIYQRPRPHKLKKGYSGDSGEGGKDG